MKPEEVEGWEDMGAAAQRELRTLMQFVEDGFGDLAPETYESMMTIHVNSFVLGWQAASEDALELIR